MFLKRWVFLGISVSQTHLVFSLTFYFTTDFSLVQIKSICKLQLILDSKTKIHCWKNRKLFTTQRSFGQVQLKAFAENKVNVAKKLKFYLGRVENMEMGDNAGYQHFSFSHNVF